MMQLRNDSNVLRFGKIYAPVGTLARSLRARNSAEIVQKMKNSAALRKIVDFIH
jgi:hypothetical protein